MNHRPPRSDGRGAERGKPTPRAGERAPANAGRVVGGRPAGGSRQEPVREDPYRRPSRTSDARWQPLPDPPTVRHEPAPRGQPAHRPLLTGGKLALTVVSVLILVVTGYYWRELESWNQDMQTADVIDQPPTERPADGAIDILMVGMDSRTDAQGKPLSDEQLAMLSAGESDGELNTDSLIMIRIPNDGKAAVGISMPRDSYVDIPGYGQHKINSAYLRAKNEAMRSLRNEGVSDKPQLEVRSNQEGAKNLIATVQELTGATIDHYAEVNLLGFYDITRAIGGIDVCLKEPVDDSYSGARFPAGKQNLSGAPALAFVRQRHGLPNGDLDRIVRQQVFMSGMAKKVFSQDMLTPGSDTLDKLKTAVQKSVVLDEDWNVVQFAQQMMTFTGGNLTFKTIPVGRPDLETPEDGSAIEVDPGAVRSFVQGLLGTKEQSSSAAPAPGAGGSGDQAGNQQITVNVRNASGQQGVADSVATALAGDGFAKGEVGNADPRDATVVRHAQGEQDAGDRVAAALGGSPVVEEDSNLPPGTVTVLLGGDFDASNVEASGNSLTRQPLLRLAPEPVGQPLLRLSPARAGQPAQPDASGCVN
ncbi:MAG: LytR family transcriptional regulator [Actinophytocola sp.]|uniref:LCP family protein n=1 Tax=Actinophytocola sp. TaxID=1872138 RepID=UPI0013256E6B|nr:LCP family protein [Actinophytocola sp.]MPZ84443.1 LytR family transcriptional regulator [Actinophytocola sp.]